MAVAACSSGNSGSGASSSSADNRPANPDAVLRMSSTVGNRTYDPAKAPTCAGEFPTLQPVYARLINMKPDLSLEPMLATAWKFSDDGTSLTVNLRDPVKFREGSPFDATAVKANLDRYMTLQGSTVKQYLGSITNVEVVDPKTVKIDL